MVELRTQGFHKLKEGKGFNRFQRGKGKNRKQYADLIVENKKLKSELKQAQDLYLELQKDFADLMLERE